MTSQIALWSMAKSPLMYGGDLRHLDNDTLSIITNPTLLKINHYSINNMEVPCILFVLIEHFVGVNTTLSLYKFPVPSCAQ